MPNMASSSSSSTYHDLFVGTFNTPHLYTLRFTPPDNSSSSSSSAKSQQGTLDILHRSPAIGSHSWLHLSPRRKNGIRNLYATAWTEPPSVVAYSVNSPTDIQLLGQAQTKSRSGYVAASEIAVYSAGGATGEVFALDHDTGAFVNPKASSSESTSTDPATPVQPLQLLSFVDAQSQRDDGSVMDFGGLRHGAHSVDLSPSGSALYIADIGRNCIWTYSIDPSTGSLQLGEKHISPRPTDGPRHVWPHPNGRVVYVLQEHTSMVDVFTVDVETGTKLTHVQAVRIIPETEQEGDFWADEVRTSLSAGDRPKWMYASTRGLTSDKKGYVAVYGLDDDGLIVNAPIISSAANQDPYAGLAYMYETPTSGGWANAVQPGPTIQGKEYLALTDSELGFVFILSWDGSTLVEVARTQLDQGAGAATAVWL
ncbi:hypothetical protein PV10_03528 [Exophiala mesophila]|uniref:Muconate cycloisomerase 1 n=1 Tax=Exophiala mesophila TaxID=212818 RepID=A0A0D1X2E5_EXOME|nr:uncharacterized protein PV10_03528 [Exophiala mesophila]KIV95935.1 hypothetical protein PV10_03528 [Exophiala mesophila]